MAEELWKAIEGLEGYEVSSFGRVRSWIKTVRNPIVPHILKTTIHKKSKYEHIKVGWNSKWLAVHRAVAVAFIPNPEKKRCVNHLDSNRSNNRIENLEWATHRENALHSYDFNNRKCPRRRLTDDQIMWVFKNPESLSYVELAKRIGCNRRVIHKIWNGDLHSKITKINQ